MSCRIACVAIASLAFVTGCAPSAPTAPASATTAAGHSHDGHEGHDDHDHDHGDHEEPETVAAGLAKLEKICADAKTHLAAGDYDKADGPVHMAGHLLEDLGKLVAKEKPAAEAEARKALDAMFECFDKIDSAIHAADDEARKQLDYAEHAPAIEAAIAKLKELTK